MYKVVFEYADGRRGDCIEDGSVRLFETEPKAADFAKKLNDEIHIYLCAMYNFEKKLSEIDGNLRNLFPVYRAEKYEGESETAPKKIIDTVYSPEGDMTFIMEDVYDAKGEPLSTECVGWYYGEPDAEATATFTGKLKAEYFMGREGTE